MNENIDIIKFLEESQDLEFKKAKNTFPEDALSTYSAFANTNGGFLTLGVEEFEEGKFNILGVEDSNKIIKSMFDLLNNSNKVNRCIIDDSHIETHTIENKTIIVIEIPAADYKEKPIYLKNNPFNSYKRNHTGDYKLKKEIIIRKLENEPIENTN